MQKKLYLGLDLGSTTAKLVVTDEHDHILHQAYERHYSKVREKTAELVRNASDLLRNAELRVAVTGSAGFGVCRASGLDFVQEVFATAGAVRAFLPGSDCVIELGGEDAKIIFLTGGLEERMNGTCAGGTGAFIDQMATLLNISPAELNEYASRHERIYPIASRCGVFAKSDIQPLLNQGAKKEDLAASILQAVVSQTVSGLAQGRVIQGRVVFLGGPLFYFSELRRQFAETLGLSAEDTIFPDNAQCFVALGAALYAKDNKPVSWEELGGLLEKAQAVSEAPRTLPPLFSSQEEYEDFTARHAKFNVVRIPPETYGGDAYLGIDAGSTTTKLALIEPQGGILYEYYASNNGSPVAVIHEQLLKIRQLCGERIRIRSSAVTGYGEALIQNAFNVDASCVETVAHLAAARHFNPEVDYILDIGGQDIKCFKIRKGTVDGIMLNEACSSGCGSFIETYATALGYSAADFARLGFFAKAPANLGSRCTVFMNSSIKQAQREGAGVDDISAGLSISVVKNVMYKVIRTPDPAMLGRNIVVQGGTFLNDAVLRAFENEVGREVVRPPIAGIMGAFGAALYAKSREPENESSLLSGEQLSAFTHSAKGAQCGLCGNRCNLTVNSFSGNRRFISGNRCDRPTGIRERTDLPNLFKFKYEYITKTGKAGGKRGKIGFPLGLNMYENLPFWRELFEKMDFEVVLSAPSTRDLYMIGQHTIPSDTICYPAKLLHGHVLSLIEMGVQRIFYPCMSYNFDEKKGDNHYNCPVVAYYPELLTANMDEIGEIRFYNDYFGLHRRRDFKRRFAEFAKREFSVGEAEVRSAVDAAYAAHARYLGDIRAEGERAVAYARENGLRMAVLAGRPYHIDPEINHGMDGLLTSLGLVVLSEDSVSHLAKPKKVSVLNQWTYHSRLYTAAEYVAGQPDMELVQLVSFGCGLDAITTDEVRELLESRGRLYTQIKIDEINNLSTAKIRLRSLIAAVESRESCV